VTATRSTTCSPGLLNSGDRPDGYERGEAVVARVLVAIEVIATARTAHRLLVVSNEGVISAIEGHTRVKSGEWRRLDNLEGRRFDLTDGDLRARGPRIHLLDAEADTSDVNGYP